MTEPNQGPRTPARQGAAPRLRSPLVLAVVIALVAVAAYLVAVNAMCANRRCEPTPNPTPNVVSPVDGVVLSVDAESLNVVRGFTLQPTTGGGFSFTFDVGDLENPTEFPPAHLAEHQATASPIRVYFRTENGRHIVYRLEDAPG